MELKGGNRRMDEFTTKNDSEGRQGRPPIVEAQISKSKDGKWIIHRTIITDIKPVGYFQAVLRDD
jgi:hypothetical protein